MIIAEISCPAIKFTPTGNRFNAIKRTAVFKTYLGKLPIILGYFLANKPTKT